jgi:hypothetical protein
MASSKTVRILFSVFFSLVATGMVSSASISIPMFRLLTRGAVSGGSLGLNTRANIDVALEGGYKFGGRIAFSLVNEDLEADSELGSTYDAAEIRAALARTLTFQSAQVVVREAFGTPMELTYFTGSIERFASGSSFPELFGSIPFTTDFSGYVYFPTGVSYEGIHAVAGTGFAVSTNQWLESLRFLGYLYQDAWLGSGTYSSDVRLLLNTDQLKLEYFLGATFPKGPYGYYRTGLMLFYSTGVGGEFFTQIGVPRFAPGQDTALTIDHFYFLFEPRVDLGLLSIILTLFWHPEYYLLSATGEDGAVDINAKFLLGHRTETKVSGGLENRVALRPAEDNQLTAYVSPFLEVNSSGVLWDFKINARLFPFSPADMFEGFVGVRTEF